MIRQSTYLDFQLAPAHLHQPVAQQGFRTKPVSGNKTKSVEFGLLKGVGPGLIRQQQFISACLFGAVCPERDIGIALVLPMANTEAMALHLAEIAKQTPKGRHAGVIFDNAGYHHSDELPKYENVSLIPLPSYAPELKQRRATLGVAQR